MNVRRQTWINAVLLLGMTFGWPLIPGTLVPVPPPREVRADETTNVPSYRTLPTAGQPRQLLKSTPIVLSQNAPRVLAITPSSTVSPIVVIDEHGVVHRFDFAGKEQPPTRPNTAKLLTCAAISPNGKVHATVDLAGNVALIDVNSGRRELPRDPFGPRTTALLFSADGNRLATATSAGKVDVWNAANAKHIETKESVAGAVQFLAFSPQGKFMACASMEGGVIIYAQTDDASPVTIPDDAPRNTALAFSPDGKRLAIGKANGTIRIVDLATKQNTVLSGHTFAVWGLAFDPWHDRLASASWDGTAKLWDTASNRLLASYKGHEESVSKMAFTPDGGLVSASLDSSLKYWAPDIPSQGPTAELAGRAGPIWVATYSPDGKRLFVGGDRQQFELWDLPSGTLNWTKKGHQTTRCAVFAPDGDQLVTGSSDREVRVWDVRSGALTMTLKGHPGMVSAVRITPDRKTLVSACDGGVVKLWNLANGQETATLLGHRRQVYCAAISPDGKRLVTGGGDWTGNVPGELIVWDLTTGKSIKTVDGHRLAIWTISFCGDGRQIATSSSDGLVKVRDLATLEVQQTLQHSTWVRPMSCSPDGKTLAVGRGDGSIRLWDTTTWQERASLDAHDGFTFFLQFAPDGRQLATAGNDGTVRLWSVK